jgi:bifunctional oligoribonuclease and PAP phosphatase NrnA
MAEPADPKALIIQTIRKNNNFLLASHVSPDGDAVGSMSALGWLLTSIGKEVAIYSPDPIPIQYAWLKLPVPVRNEVPDPATRWTIVLDCGDRSRMGRELDRVLVKDRTILIDHHQNNPGIGPQDWIDPERSSVGEMIAELALAMEIPLEGDLAQALYLAIVTDTGFFTFGNTTPRALDIVGELYRHGLNPGMVNATIQNQWTINRLHLQGVVLQEAQLFFDGQVGLASIPSSLYEKTGTTKEDTEGLVNFLGRVKGVRVAALLRQNGDGKVRFSLRSVGSTDVQRIARLFQGGGHRNAAGGTIEGDLTSARKKLLAAIGESLGLAGDG